MHGRAGTMAAEAANGAVECANVVECDVIRSMMHQKAAGGKPHGELRRRSCASRVAGTGAARCYETGRGSPGAVPMRSRSVRCISATSSSTQLRNRTTFGSTALRGACTQ